MQVRHAIFATMTGDHYRARVTRWSDWGKAQDEWTRLNDLRVEGKLSGVKFLECRGGDDPKYNQLPLEPWHVLTAEEKPAYVKLDRAERGRLLDIGRKAGDLELASDAIFTELAADGRWNHLAAVTISDYAWSAARFCFPREAHNL